MSITLHPMIKPDGKIAKIIEQAIENIKNAKAVDVNSQEYTNILTNTIDSHINNSNIDEVYLEIGDKGRTPGDHCEKDIKEYILHSYIANSVIDNLRKEYKMPHLTYRGTGSISSETWLNDGQYHREDAPAVIKYYENGSVQSEEWYINDKLHREDGPAEIYYDEAGSVEVEAYHINGKELSKSDFEKVTKEIKKTEISSPDKSTDKPKHKGPSL